MMKVLKTTRKTVTAFYKVYSITFDTIVEILFDIPKSSTAEEMYCTSSYRLTSDGAIMRIED